MRNKRSAASFYVWFHLVSLEKSGYFCEDNCSKFDVKLEAVTVFVFYRAGSRIASKLKRYESLSKSFNNLNKQRKKCLTKELYKQWI